MEYLKKIRSFIINRDQKSKILISAFVILGIVSILLPSPQNEKAPLPTAATNETSVDTYIPSGYVLVPIELANANSLSSLLGATGGVIDLYLPQGKASIKVASKLKILKAPYNPDLYAVLVREQESSKILSYAGPFVAVVQNPGEKGQKLVETTRTKISIEYQN
jgi:hypothetical protein